MSLIFSALFFIQLLSNPIHADSTRLATAELHRQRSVVASNLSMPPSERAKKLMLLGDFDQALNVLQGQDDPASMMQLAWFWYRQNDFKKAEDLLSQLNVNDAISNDVQLLKASLLVQAWNLDAAMAVCDAVLSNSGNADMLYLKARIYFLQKKFNEARDLSKKLQNDFPDFAGGYLLEADYYVWQQKPADAEPLLQKTLALNPFDADARFLYGYAIWRRVDATQLVDMAAQWELALTIDPLHYMTHWHWGNGHTHLTYRDYAQSDDEEVRGKLASAESLFTDNNIDAAVLYTYQIEREHPTSVLPHMYRASYFYSAFDREPVARLDSARRIFEHILQVKPHYGPAHNGLASVLRAQRIPYLAAHDSIIQSLRDAEIYDELLFARIFPDMDYFPGRIVRKMAWTQLHTAQAYLSLLDRLGRSFVIPPLHIDLTIAMNSPFFRQSTTFDNRQWMDIRGVGSGAAAIEYVQKAAFLDRNVLLHEFVHLFHGTILTDYQVRRIRQLYYQAMRDGLTLDYYAANNESEYFAQVYPAYFSEEKIHPLDFKSTNTRNDLMLKDPDAYAFMDSLVAGERSAIAGNKQALAGNWAQAYVTLSRQTRRGNEPTAMALLDTALTWQPDYIPAMLSYADVNIRLGKHDEARIWLDKVMDLNPNYAPLYVTLAALEGSRVAADSVSTLQETYMRKAYDLETDVQEKAGIARQLYTYYLANADIPSAIEMAEEYASEGSAISTYLRDRIDDATAFAAALRVDIGYGAATRLLAELVTKKPQNFAYRKMYADALALTDEYQSAIATLEESQSILRAAGTPRNDFNLKIADYYYRSGNDTQARSILDSIRDFQPTATADAMLKIRLTAQLGSPNEALTAMQARSKPNSKYESSDWFYTLAVIHSITSDAAMTKKNLIDAITKNPFNMDAQLMLEAMQ